VYADVNILGRSVHDIEEREKSVLVSSKKIGTEVNADNSKYKIMSRDQNAGGYNSI
jgi:hypothetical protein